MYPSYFIMGSIKCPKIKKHIGVKIRPLDKSFEPNSPGYSIVYTCETTEQTQSIKCLDDGHWSDQPTCPDPTNSTCPPLEHLLNGSFNASAPYKVGTIVAFKCDNDNFMPPQQLQHQSQQQPPTTTTTLTTTPATPTTPTIALTTFRERDGFDFSHLSGPKFNLSGPRTIRCLASSKWSHEQPVCVPLTSKQFPLMAILLITIPILILVIFIRLFVRWKRRQRQRARWKQYFTDYKYRHSKTSITIGLKNQRQDPSSSSSGVQHQQQHHNSSQQQQDQPLASTSAANSNGTSIPITDL